MCFLLKFMKKILLSTILNIVPFVVCGYFLPTNNFVIIEHNSYTIAYDTNYNHAVWCEYTLTSNQLCTVSNIKRTNDFRPDPYLLNNTNILVVIDNNCYYNSGFDKGHLCPAQDRSYSKEDMSETFYLSNMSPQEPSFNRGIWKKLEEFTRRYAILKGEITVVTGPVIFNRYFILDNKISIPHMYFKILITKDNHCLCFIIPNQKSDYKIEDYCVTLNYLLVLLNMK